LREFSIAYLRSLARPLSDYQSQYPTRDEAMAQIAAHFGVHYMTVSRAVKAADL
jgi:putative transposase